MQKVKDERKTLTVRLAPADWLVIRKVALDHGMAVQDLLIQAASEWMERRGLPGLGKPEGGQ